MIYYAKVQQNFTGKNIKIQTIWHFWLFFMWLFLWLEHVFSMQHHHHPNVYFLHVILTLSPLLCRALTEIFLASPILGVIGTRNGDSGMCSSLNLMDTKYSPVNNSMSKYFITCLFNHFGKDICRNIQDY